MKKVILVLAVFLVMAGTMFAQDISYKNEVINTYAEDAVSYYGVVKPGWLVHESIPVNIWIQMTSRLFAW